MEETVATSLLSNGDGHFAVRDDLGRGGIGDQHAELIWLFGKPCADSCLVAKG